MEDQPEAPLVARLRRQPLHVRERFLQRSERLGVRVAARGLLGDPREAFHGAVRLIGPSVVVGEAVVGVLEAALVESLEGARGRRVERVPLGDREALVDDLLGQGVLEDVDGLRHARLLVEEFEPGELAEMVLDVSGPPPHGLEQPERHLAPDDGGQAERILDVLGQAVNPGSQRLLDGVRHRDPAGRVGLLGDRPAQLLQEERVALRLAQDRGGERAVLAARREEALNDALAVAPRERLERQLGHVGPVHPRRPVARAVREQRADGGGLVVSISASRHSSDVRSTQ